jgi:hypothetical protein
VLFAESYRMRLAAFALVLTTSTASADGFYYSQSYGVSSARGEGAAPLGASLQLRIAFGWRFGAFTVGPVLGENMAVERDGAFYGIGGEPIMGDSDLDIYGVDGRYHATLHENLVMYVRGGPRYGRGTGDLDGYSGWGVGGGTGVQLTGRVRALGFLFLPAFFMKKGPMVTASVFLDESIEWYRLRKGGMPDVSTPIVGTAIGIAAGSHF